MTLREPLSRSGGIHSYVKLLAEGQRRLGLDVAILSEVDKAGGYTAAPSRELDLAKVDRFHFHFAHAAAPFIKHHRGTDLEGALFHFHGPWFREGLVQGNGRMRAYAKRVYEQRLYSQFQRFVTASDAFASVLIEDFGVEPSAVTTVWPAVDTDRFRPGDVHQSRAILNLPRSGPIIGCVRRLEPRMGINIAIEALQLVPDALLVVAGAGSMRRELEDQVRRLGLAERVHFLGRVSDEELPHLFRASDVVVVPTLALEGFGMVVLEAFASGTPVVASDIGGLREALGPFADSSLVPAGDAEALADKLVRELTDSRPHVDLRDYALTRKPEAVAAEVEAVFAGGPR